MRNMDKPDKKEWVDWLNAKVLQKAIVVDEAGNMLALKRTATGPASRLGKWDLPGGSIDPQDVTEGVKPHTAAIQREVVEETGLQPVEVKAVFVDSWTFTRSPGTILGIAIGYRVTVQGVKPPVQRSDEHIAELWGSKAELLALDFGEDGGLHPSIIRAV
jgi:8-oxo-dGTP pyrophosphatase MutT (NUDIX family)